MPSLDQTLPPEHTSSVAPLILSQPTLALVVPSALWTDKITAAGHYALGEAIISWFDMDARRQPGV